MWAIMICRPLVYLDEMLVIIHTSVLTMFKLFKGACSKMFEKLAGIFTFSSKVKKTFVSHLQAIRENNVCAT